MENNNMYPDYDQKSSELLKNAIISAAIASLPIGSMIAIGMASRNLNALHEYLAAGGLHTGKIKTSSAVSKIGKFGGIGFTIFWGFYLLYIIFAIFLVGAGTFLSLKGR